MRPEAQLFERLCESAPHGQIVVDAEQRVVFWNRWIVRHAGIAAEDAVGRTLVEAFGLEALPSRLGGAIVAALDDGCGSVLTRAFTPSPLPLFQLDAKRAPMVQGVELQAIERADGSRSCLIDVRDQSREARREALLKEQSLELRRQATQLEHVNQELAESNKQLDEFVHHASHDLKAPLRQVMALSDLLLDSAEEDLSVEVRRDLTAISSVAERMARCVGDLLQMARASRADMEWEPVALDTCVDDALASLEFVVSERGASIERERLPVVRGHARLLTQLFQNLIGNALKFSSDTPRVRITYEERDGEVVYGVADEGDGIAREHLASIFAPFQRVETKRRVEGTGIGLSICAKAVARHGGRIWCESEPGAGAHFRFTLGGPQDAQVPRADAADQAA